MSNDLEEIKSLVFIHFGALGFCNPSMNNEIIRDRDKVLKYLDSLEAIDNANPSEALKCLDKLAKQIELDEDTDYWEIKNAHKTVEQALLKAQEQEKVLGVIFEKRVNIDVILYGRTLEDYNYYARKWLGNDCELTEEEFELLKRYCK